MKINLSFYRSWSRKNEDKMTTEDDKLLSGGNNDQSGFLPERSANSGLICICYGR